MFTARFELGVSMQYRLFSGFMGHAMSKEVSRRSVVPKGRARIQGNPCDICGEK